MPELIVKETPNSPDVNYDAVKSIYSISGNSIMMNAYEFYSTIVTWLDENKTQVQNGGKFYFNLPFFNSASAKGIVLVLKTIRNRQSEGIDLKVIWRVEKDDEFMTEAAENFSEFLEMGFEVEYA